VWIVKQLLSAPAPRDFQFKRVQRALQASSLPICAHGFRLINRLKKNEIMPLAPIGMDLPY